MDTLYGYPFFIAMKGGGIEPVAVVNEGPVGPESAAASGGNRQAERRNCKGAAACRDYCGSRNVRAALTERRRGARGDSPHLHQIRLIVLIREYLKLSTFFFLQKCL